MKVTVKLFAALREEMGSREFEQDLAPGSTVQELLDWMLEEYPALRPYVRSLHFALNHKYVTRQTELHDGDEVAFLPPVGGG